MGNRDRYPSVACGKVCFPTRVAVRKALGRYQKRWSIYWCPPCAAYHVTGSTRTTGKHSRSHTTLVRTPSDEGER